MSCVVSLVRRGIDVFITGCDVLVSNGARLDGLITTGGRNASVFMEN